jgi:hypothetical protein
METRVLLCVRKGPACGAVLIIQMEQDQMSPEMRELIDAMSICRLSGRTIA